MSDRGEGVLAGFAIVLVAWVIFIAAGTAGRLVSLWDSVLAGAR